ncbi:MAG: DNA translocase FtsK 4TM domain-containing protein [Patescibacteria group bacterium]
MLKLPNIKNIKINIDEQTRTTVFIMTCLAFGFVTLISAWGLEGPGLSSVLFSFIKLLFGRGVYIVPLGFFATAFYLYRRQLSSKLELKNEEKLTDISRIIWGNLLMLVSLVTIISNFLNISKLEDITSKDKSGWSGGLFGYVISNTLDSFLGRKGSFLFLICLFILGALILFNVSFVQAIRFIGEIIRNPKILWDKTPNFFDFGGDSDDDNTPKVNKIIDEDNSEKPEANIPLFNDLDFKMPVDSVETIEVEPEKVKTKPVFTFHQDDGIVREMVKSEARVQEKTSNPGKDWILPQYELLSDKRNKSDAGNIEVNKEVIRNTLNNFGIAVTMSDVAVGPTVSQYALQPAEGVRLSSIDALQRDLALALAATNIRIEAPIPGKKLVGVEIPNAKKETVRLRDLIQSNQFLYYNDDLPVAIGKDVTGFNYLYSLSKMPHLLVAGATGAGKSVWINGLLLSLLYRYSKDQLGLILVDMKRVELKLYEGIPHLLYPVITESEKAVNALKWTVLEMDKRYRILEESSKRNIKDYNKYAKTYGKDQLKYIVLVIDELGDLMMLAKNEVEPIIVRLTQMARAVGIHVVLGTQRPDTQVVTGLIKANIPTRIAFAVASQIDSRVILDQVGAEKLLGQGDGLIVTPSSIGARRFQGALVEESEIKKVVQFLKDQVKDLIEDTNYTEAVGQKPSVKINVPGMQIGKNNDSLFDDDGNQIDSSYEQAKKLVVQFQKASTSFLQNRMGIGYPKAAKIIMQLEENGIVGPANGSKPRDVYLKDEDYNN